MTHSLRTCAWTLLLAAALLWPSPVVSLFDGAPLDRPPEAIVVPNSISLQHPRLSKEVAQVQSPCGSTARQA